MCRIIPPLTDAEKIVEIYGHSMHQLSVVETTESTSTSPPPSPTNIGGDGARPSSPSASSPTSRTSSNSINLIAKMTSRKSETKKIVSTEFIIALDTEQKLDRWSHAIQQGINGEVSCGGRAKNIHNIFAFAAQHTTNKKLPPLPFTQIHSPCFLGHNSNLEHPTSSTVVKTANKLITYPYKKGLMRKKAIGKKLLGVRNWKKRYFKLEAGDLRYYREKSFKSSSLKGFVSLKDSPDFATTGGGGGGDSKSKSKSKQDLSCILVPVTDGSGILECRCESEIEALDWMEKINETIKLARAAVVAGEGGEASTSR